MEFKYCSDHKKELHEVMGWRGPVTYRQFITWCVWERMQWNEPDRHDHYIMLLITTVRQILAKNPSNIKIKDAKLNFTTENGKGVDQNSNISHLSQEDMLEMVKSVWRARLGGGTVRSIEDGQRSRTNDCKDD